MLDANKTDLTHKLTALASGYLSAIGCKPVETEVVVAPCWIADVASFFYPTMTEARNAKLLNKFLCPEELDGANAKHNYLMRQYGAPLTVLVEVKTSKEDFRKDIERKFKAGGAHLNYLAYPKSLSETVENELQYPFNYHWGQLICSDDGERITKIKAPQYVWPKHHGEITEFVCQVAIRRDHRTSKRWLRDILKSYRADRKERIAVCKDCQKEFIRTTGQ